MIGLRNSRVIASEIDEATREIERLTARVHALRKELNISDKTPEIQAVLDSQHVSPTLRDGTIASPLEILRERLDTDLVSPKHATDITDTYVHLCASLNVRERNISLPAYGDGSMESDQVLNKLEASDTLRELLRYKNDDIGRFITIASTGYISMQR